MNRNTFQGDHLAQIHRTYKHFMVPKESSSFMVLPFTVVNAPHQMVTMLPLQYFQCPVTQ